MKRGLFRWQKRDISMKKIETFRFLLVFVLLFSLFYGLAFVTASLEWTWARIVIGLATVSAVTIAWSLINKMSIPRSFREVGFGIPDWRLFGISALLSASMLAFFPVYFSLANMQLSLQSNWPWILVGMICGVGIAEETLFRGYVFNSLRKTRSFWQAATHSMLLFGAMHLLLLLWLPLPVAIAAIVLAILAAYPAAYLFEASNGTIWPSALLHTAALATNLIEIPENLAVSLNLMWIGVIVIGLFLVFAAGKTVPNKTNFSQVGESNHT